MTLMDKRQQEPLEFTIIRNISFTVERKKQSVVVRNNKTDCLYVFTKGADEEIFHLLSLESAKSAEALQQMSNVDSFGREGLRTLVFAVRFL